MNPKLRRALDWMNGAKAVLIQASAQARRTVVAVAGYEVPAKTYERWGLYTQTGIIVLFYSLAELWPSFTGHPLYTGYMIAALALAAVVMTARADRLTNAEKIIWIAICAVLFIWELHIIDVDHEVQDAQHRADVVQQEKDFAAVLTTNQESFRETMQALAESQKEQQKEFAATMQQFSKNESANQTRFNKLVDHEEKLAEAEDGVLVPGNDPTPPHPECDEYPPEYPIPPEAVFVFLDDGRGEGLQAIVIRDFPQNFLVSQSRGKIITLKKTATGVAVVVDLRSSDGKIIARLDERGFVINRNNSLAIKKDDHNLDVLDLYGIDVLNIKYLNPHAILVGGSVFSQVHPGVHIRCMDGFGNQNLFVIP